MTDKELDQLARQYAKPVQEQNADVEYLFTLAGVAALIKAAQTQNPTAED
jgi:hypothetical protein